MKRLVVLGIFTALGCGPSFQTIYENDARFEHCYALDESGVSLDQKSKCWDDWKAHHTFGQTRDRVDYAQARVVALSQSDVPTDEAMMQAAPGEVGESNKLTAPAPTNAFAPPPQAMDADAGTRSQAPFSAMSAMTATQPPAAFDAGASARPPGAACSDDCARVWQDCKGQSSAGSGDTKKCDAPYDRCVVSCLHR
jgi:hypothetical protein